MFQGENNWKRMVFNKGLFLFVVMNFQVLLPQIGYLDCLFLQQLLVFGLVYS